MIGVFARLIRRPSKQGRVSNHIPVFDGALKGNEVLQTASVVARLHDPSDLTTDGTQILVAEGANVVSINEMGLHRVVIESKRRITALAAIADGVACALEGREIRVFGGRFDGARFIGHESQPFHAVNALSARGTTLIVTDGSQSRSDHEWRHDLMESGRSGRVFWIDFETGKVSKIGADLMYAYGAAALQGETLVSESWAHRLIAIDKNGRTRLVEEEFPAYPSRISVGSDGYWLTMFCARTELVEFVLREPEYRRRMMASLDPDLWIVPQLRSFTHIQEPAQWGAIRRDGVIKPWAPPRSYGLVVKLDAVGKPQYSFHSRMSGPFHGIVAAAEMEGWLYLLSKGDNALVKIDIAKAEEGLRR